MYTYFTPILPYFGKISLGNNMNCLQKVNKDLYLTIFTNKTRNRAQFSLLPCHLKLIQKSLKQKTLNDFEIFHWFNISIVVFANLLKRRIEIGARVRKSSKCQAKWKIELMLLQLLLSKAIALVLFSNMFFYNFCNMKIT